MEISRGGKIEGEGGEAEMSGRVGVRYVGVAQVAARRRGPVVVQFLGSS